MYTSLLRFTRDCYALHEVAINLQEPAMRLQGPAMVYTSLLRFKRDCHALYEAAFHLQKRAMLYMKLLAVIASPPPMINNGLKIFP